MAKYAFTIICLFVNYFIIHFLHPTNFDLSLYDYIISADDDRVPHHSVLGMFREWLFGESDWTIETLSKFNYRNTPDFLKEAFADYPYRINDIMNSLAE